MYPSIKQARFAEGLALRLKAGDIAAWQTEVSIRLTVAGVPLRPFGASRDCFYRADFVITRNDGTTEIVDVKGFVDPRSPVTSLWRIKLALLQAMHPDWVVRTD